MTERIHRQAGRNRSVSLIVSCGNAPIGIAFMRRLRNLAVDIPGDSAATGTMTDMNYFVQLERFDEYRSIIG